jgi:hypothetical protein
MPRFEALLPLLISMSTLIAMVSLRNSDVATRARNCHAELLYQVHALKLQSEQSGSLQGAPTDARGRSAERVERRKENLLEQIKHFEQRYKSLSMAYVLLVLAVAGLGLYGTSTLFLLIPEWLCQAILYAGLILFIAGILIMVWEAIVGSRTLELNSKA